MLSLRLPAVLLLAGLGAAASVVNGGPQTTTTLRGSLAAPTHTSAPSTIDVRFEGRLPGTPGWRISKARGSRTGLSAYARAVSVTSGQPVPLAISANGPVQVRAFRIGWYRGVGARRVWVGTLPAQPETGDPQTWPARGTVDTTAWPQGHYLLRLDAGPASRYVPLTVRTADNQGRVVVLTSPLTWQAENTPAAPATTAPAPLPTISFDRPYTAGYGSAGFLEQDARIAQLVERAGLKVGYATDHDVAEDPDLLTGAAAVLVGGNSQYWTAALRTAVRAAEDAGTNLAFFGAGTGARQVKLVDDGRALQVSRARPSTSPRLTGLRPSCSTESAVAGWPITDTAWWGYQGVSTGGVLPGLIAGRVDRAAGTASSGRLLTDRRVDCAGRAVTQNGVYLVRASGAGVFTAGTGRWACALIGRCTDASGRSVRISPTTQRAVTRITRNVIEEFAVKKAGRRLGRVS